MRYEAKQPLSVGTNLRGGCISFQKSDNSPYSTRLTNGEKKIIMKCWHCNTELIWGSDFDGEDYGCEDIAIVTNLSCPKCHSTVEVYLPKDTEQND